MSEIGPADQMRLLITGANGLLGINLALEARRRHEVTGVDRGRLTGVPFEVLNLDLLKQGAIEEALNRSHADAVIHCAAIADVDACERSPEEAQRVNAELPGALAAACRLHGIALVHVSTDAVFDGTKSTAYTEEDQPSPASVYAATKLAGERAVRAENPAAAVARVNFFGWSVNGRRSLAEFFVNNLRAGRTVRGFVDVKFCPMFVVDLAHLLLLMLERKLEGLYHAVGAEAMSKYDFGVAIARRFGLDENLIEPASVQDAGLAAKRSHNLHLAVHRLSTALMGEYPAFSTGVDGLYAQDRHGYPQQLHSYEQAG